MAGPTDIEVRPGDTKVFTDTVTDTLTGDPVTADLTDGWEAVCQIRENYAQSSPIVAEFTCEITGPNAVQRTLFEDQSRSLDDVPFTDSAYKGKRTVYWDAQLRLPDGLAAGEDYVVTYLSGKIKILGQVSRDA